MTDRAYTLCVTIAKKKNNAKGLQAVHNARLTLMIITFPAVEQALSFGICTHTSTHVHIKGDAHMYCTHKHFINFSSFLFPVRNSTYYTHTYTYTFAPHIRPMLNGCFANQNILHIWAENRL